ncbi:hypothetical protein POTOM_031505 [Populus tomentosa]|uniref:peroxidase n=1 Tax=Populus tomentosa TaxID=118781 RepID=A0A8X7Z7G9_POPTO|nr:hypothetical protein POTOM_031505 [Populus tomentosa]
MAMGLSICFMMLIKLVIALAKTPTTLNTTCVGDIGVLLQFGVYQESCPEAQPIILSWSGGPGWEVQTGRRDSLTASKAAATNNIPAPNSSVATLVANFQNVGLTQNDMVALSGAHTMGKARCSTFSSRFQSPSNSGGPDVNTDFVQSLQQLCSETADSTATVAHLDLVTPATFDNQYYVNLLSGEGLLPSDQVLVDQDDRTREIVEAYAEDPLLFFEDFKNSMLRMGALGPLTGDSGEIRVNCRAVN